MYGESHYAEEKNDIFYKIREFLKSHPISELVRIVADAIEYEKEEYLIALSVLLEKVNETGDEGKSRFKKLCEDNGMLFYNAFRTIKNIGNDLIDSGLPQFVRTVQKRPIW